MPKLKPQLLSGSIGIDATMGAPTFLKQNCLFDRMQTARQLPPRVPLPVATCVLWTVGSVGVITASFVLRVGAERAVLVPGLEAPIPETCALYSRFAVDCPGCGLTRTFIHLSHGDLSHAWQLNPVGVFLYGFVVLQIGLASYHLLAALNQLRIREWVARLTDLNQALLITVAVALFGQWIFRLVF